MRCDHWVRAGGGRGPAGRRRRYETQGREGPLGAPWELSLWEEAAPRQSPAPPGVREAGLRAGGPGQQSRPSLPTAFMALA